MTAEIIQDDVLHALQDFERRGEKFDAVVMDPPYCSGGLMPAQITRGSFGKYIKATDFEEFNDGMSSLVYYRFMIEVFTRCLRVLNKPGYIFTFIDWRMYPVIYEALERGGGTCFGRDLLEQKQRHSTPRNVPTVLRTYIIRDKRARQNNKTRRHGRYRLPRAAFGATDTPDPKAYGRI